MASEAQLHHVLGGVVERLSRTRSVDETATAVVDEARSVLEVDHAGVTLQVSRQVFRSAGTPTGSIAETADDLQHELQAGPCVDAASDRELSRWSADLASDPRWGRWGPRAAALGLRSVLSARLRSGGRTVGALNLYSTTTHRFGAEHATVAQLFAVHAAAALVFAERLENAERALETRTLIGQAQGMIMQRFEVDAEQAFGLLRRYSQQANVKLVDVASDLTTTGRLPDEVQR